MRVRGVGRLKRLARRINNLFVPRAIVLLYHRVANLLSDPQLLCVTPDHFAEHLEVLRSLARPIRLRALEETLGHKTNGSCAVIVTLDDGYADNLYNAKPLLERHGVPATVFVASGYVGRQREFLQDELERLLLRPGTIPEMLCLNVSGTSYRWELGAKARYDENRFISHRAWTVAEKSDPTPRHSLYRALFDIFQPLAETERRRHLDALFEWAGIEPTARPTHRALSGEEVMQLADGGLIEVGSHTANHPLLAALPVAAQKDEIVAGKARLEEILGRPVTSFAYPYGRRCDYTAETVAAVREAGFDCACSNFAGVIRPDSDRWQLPRFLIRDWNGDEFAARLSAWLAE